MDMFRQMVNLAIAIGLETRRTSLKSLSLASYHQLKIFNIPSRYRLCAISRATGILKNYRSLSKKHSARIPYCRRPGLNMCYGLKIRNRELSLTGGLSIPLNDHTLRVLSEPGLKLRSITLTAYTMGISYSKKTKAVECQGMMGIDRNLNNVTAADSVGNIIIHDLSRITKTKLASRQTIARFKRSDDRIRQRIASKYGRIQRNRTNWLLHNVSRKLVNHATKNRFSIVVERITGIRRLYRKGNGQTRYHRAQLNSWSYHELDKQLSYKTSWNGLPVVHVNPKGTSSKCSACGDQMVFSKESRTLRCSTCSLVIDRDVNAARNILSAGLRFSLKGPSDEAMKGNPMIMAIPGVDDGQSSHEKTPTDPTEDLTEPNLRN